MRKKFITGAAVLALLMNSPQVSAQDDIIIFGGEFDNETPAPKKVEKPAPKKELPPKPQNKSPENSKAPESKSPPKEKVNEPPIVNQPSVTVKPVEKVDEPPIVQQPPVTVKPVEKVDEPPIVQQPPVTVKPVEKVKEPPIVQQPPVTVKPVEKVKEPPIVQQPPVTVKPVEKVDEPPIVNQPSVTVKPVEKVDEPPIVQQPPVTVKPVEKVDEPPIVQQPPVTVKPVEKVDEPPIVNQPPVTVKPVEKVKEPPIVNQPFVTESPRRIVRDAYDEPSTDLKTLKPRFVKLAVDETYTYYLDKSSVQWKKMPYSSSEYIADVWIRMVERQPKTLDSNMASYGAENFRAEIDLAREKGYQYSPEDLKVLRSQAYVLEHYYLRPKTKQIQFLCELEVFGRPQNTINERAYDYQNWENLVPGSVESIIYAATIKTIGKSKSTERGHMTFFDMLDEYARIALN